jgi:peptidoglycan/xylan/chitin deacetylase (PgdA/CDA1 family)
MRAVLTYHSIDRSGSPISVEPAAFARHLEWLASGAVRVVGLDALIEGDPGDDAVALTFDDAFANLATEAAPRLAERGLPATVFVVTRQVGRDNAWGGRSAPGIPTLPLLGWEAIGRLAEQGFAVGSHTQTHPRLPRLTAPAVEEELAGSAATIAAETGTRPRWLAYPYGANDAAVRGVAGRHYAGAVTTEHRVVRVREDRTGIPRLDAYYFQSAGAFRNWSTLGFRGAIWARHVARSVRASLVTG